MKCSTKTTDRQNVVKIFHNIIIPNNLYLLKLQFLPTSVVYIKKYVQPTFTQTLTKTHTHTFIQI